MHARGVAFVLLAVLVASACSSSSRQSGGTFTLVGCEPKSLFPQDSGFDPCARQVLEGLFTRLMDYDPETRQPVYALAESITIAPEDPLTSIIKIKDGYKFHNGEPVTAQSFVDAWNWGARHGGGIFGGFQGFADLNPGEGKEPTATTLSGLRVIDGRTFRASLVAPFSLGLLALTLDEFDPLPKAFFRDPEAWGEKPIGEGPYQMNGPWQHRRAINLKRYPSYAGTPGRADHVAIGLAGGGLVELVRGDVDITRVRSDEFDPARRELGPRSLESVVRFHQRLIQWLDYLAFPVYDQRFANKELRQAFSLAIDRAAVILPEYRGSAMPAASVLPPDMDGYREAACRYCHLDVALARAKLASAGGWEGKLIIEYGGDAVQLDIDAVAEQIRQNLGIADVEVQRPDFFDLLDRLGRKEVKGPFSKTMSMGWPGPQNFIQQEYADGYGTLYSSPELEELMGSANGAPSLAEGLALYQQAEDLLLEDMPIVPLLYPSESWGYSTRLSGVEFTAVGLLRLESVSVSGS